MSIYQKLQQARVMLQQEKMKKSGINAFAKYHYFELGDFLPQTQDIFNKVGLCGIITFTDDLAKLSIYEHTGDGIITITSPMSKADLKGCHPVQNLGAVQTYQRRYLWMSAMEVVEHDALDSGINQESGRSKADIIIGDKSDTYKIKHKGIANNIISSSIPTGEVSRLIEVLGNSTSIIEVNKLWQQDIKNIWNDLSTKDQEDLRAQANNAKSRIKGEKK